MDEIPLQRSQLNDLQQGHEDVLEQIRQSQKTIEQSRALIERIDAQLAQAVQKRP